MKNISISEIISCIAFYNGYEEWLLNLADTLENSENKIFDEVYNV